MKNIIKIISLIILFSLNTYAQKSKISPLDPRKYDAWSVEYPEYRLFFESYIEQYKIINPVDSLIVDVKPNDKVIIVTSVLEKDINKKIFEIWYGLDGQYTIIPREKITWIFGTEFQKILVEKNYFHLDSKVVFFDSDQGRIANTYLSTNDLWTDKSIIISTEKIFSKIPGRPDYAMTINLSNELLGYPKGIYNNVGLGISMKLVEIGILIPFNGYKYPLFVIDSSNVQGNTGDEYYGSLYGGYGKFDISGIKGNIEFHATPINADDINTNSDETINSMIGLLKASITTKIDLLKSEYSSIRPRISLYPGIYTHRYNLFDLNVDEGNSLTSIPYNETNLYARLEYISIIKKDYPLIESFYQLMLNHSSILSLSVNISKNFSLRFDSIHYFDSDITVGLPKDLFTVGIRIKLDY